MRGGGAWALIIVALLLITIVPGNVLAEDEVVLEFGPNEVISDEVNEFTFTFHNTADREIVLNDAMAVIDWPGISFFNDTFNPDQPIDFLDDEVTVPAGGSFTFRESVMIKFHGGFQVRLTAAGTYAGDSNMTTLYGTSSVFCEERQFLDTRAPLTSAISVFILLFVIGMLGFFVQGAYWEYEIKKNLEDKDRDEFQQFKWFLHIWWNEGHKIRVVLFFAALALLIALMVYSALS